MKLLEFARGSAFWAMDFLKGKKVRSALNILRNCEDGIWSEEQIRCYQEEQIQKLLTHAKTTVPFYNKQNDTVLQNWPVVNKNILRSNGDDVLSSQYQKDELIAMSTSGSTGTPFTCWQNIDKKSVSTRKPFTIMVKRVFPLDGELFIFAQLLQKRRRTLYSSLRRISICLTVRT